MSKIIKTEANRDGLRGQMRGTLALVAAATLLLTMQVPMSMADQETAPAIQESDGLKLPADLQTKQKDVNGSGSDVIQGVTPKFEIEEKRVGGRLERVTVKRANGLDEVYENKEIDSMFSKEANELGEVQNVRRWTIGTF